MSVMQSAEVGLELGSALGHAYLVPFRNQDGQWEAKFIPGYKGLIHLVRQSGTVKDLQCELVYEKDVFEREYGFEPKFRHVPADGERGKMRGAYAIFRYKDGGQQAAYMTKAEIDLIKARALATKKNVAKSPWTTDEGEQQKKTVVKRLCKLAPVSREVSTAIAQDDDAEERRLDTSALDGLDFSTPGEEASSAPAEVHNPVTGEVVDGEMVAKKEETPPADKTSVALKNALKSIARARETKDTKLLGDTASVIKEDLKGDEHTKALEEWRKVKLEIDGVPKARVHITDVNEDGEETNGQVPNSQ
jgi:recombination protein RecT